MPDQATIIPITSRLKKVRKRKAIVKTMVSPGDKAFLSSLAKIFVTKILQP